MAKKVPGQESGIRGRVSVTVRALPGTSRFILSEAVRRVLDLGAAAGDPEAVKAAVLDGDGSGRRIVHVNVNRIEPRSCPPFTWVTVDMALGGSGATVDEMLPERRSYCGFD